MPNFFGLLCGFTIFMKMSVQEAGPDDAGTEMRIPRNRWQSRIIKLFGQVGLAETAPVSVWSQTVIRFCPPAGSANNGNGGQKRTETETY